jgi:hypothetical protein
LFGFFRVAKQQFELAGVKPDTAAVDTVVNLDFGKLERNHRIFANRTIHAHSPLKYQITAVILHSPAFGVKKRLEICS